MTIDSFLELCKRRRTTRRFAETPVSKELLLKLLECAQWAPSGFNLQPTHFWVVQEPELKKKLLKACLSQNQVLEAPAVIVFSGDRRVAQNNLDAVIDEEYANGRMTEEYEERLRGNVKLNFDQGYGIQWIAKLIGAPFLRLFTPMPTLPAVHKRFWLAKQVMMPAMSFMLAAEAAGLATAPLEGFDEWRVKRALGIPMSHVVPIVIPVGYPMGEKPLKTRLPLEEVTHFCK